MPQNFVDIVENLNFKGNVATGFRPSGDLHYANAFTTILAATAQRLLDGKLTLTICDYDRPGPELWPIKEHGCVRYFGDIYKGERSLLDVSRSQVEEILEQLQSMESFNVDVVLLSEIQRQQGYRSNLERIIQDSQLMKEIFGMPEGLVPVFPLCHTCHTSSPYPTTYRNETLHYNCTNRECSEFEKQREMEVGDTDIDLATNYLIDPIRDITQGAQVHVFGGDYLEKRGKRGNRKVDDVEQIVGKVGHVDFFVGPYFTINGEKMGKSGRSGGVWPNEAQRRGAQNVVIEVAQNVLDYLTENRGEIGGQIDIMPTKKSASSSIVTKNTV